MSEILEKLCDSATEAHARIQENYADLNPRSWGQPKKCAKQASPSMP